ncbi:MAG: hypothetical protein JRJ84_06465, partial [Deltaproteobacteria bacterium]|nr:hypothetical protein [Deltaproteobacteria bacterium]
NNLDLRELDETSDQAILDSDDRASFAFTGLSVQVGYNIDDWTRLVFGASHRGLWGADQMGGVSGFGGWLYFNAAHLEVSTHNANPTKFTFGRQFFEIGGIPGREFVLLDVVDGVRIDQPIGDLGTVVFLPIEVPSMSSANDHADFVSFIGQAPQPLFGFRGDTLTRRHGLVLVLDGLLENLDARAYSFYTDIGAVGTGSDITYNGTLGNFSDNDWVLNAGLRASYDAGVVVPWASFDLSSGIDRKELVAGDVDTNGMSWYAGVDLPGEESGPRGQVSYFEAFGPAYGENGMQYSHGYVGMKASQVGGTLANRFMGWHPTSYVGLYGINTSPHEINRKSGTRTINANFGWALEGIGSVKAGYWFLQDTGITYLNFNDLDTIDPPYGYSREEFAAERRAGKVLGHEIDLDVVGEVSDLLSCRVNGAVFLPGEFYEIEVGRIAGDALGSDDPQMAWAANGSCWVRF